MEITKTSLGKYWQRKKLLLSEAANVNKFFFSSTQKSVRRSSCDVIRKLSLTSLCCCTKHLITFYLLPLTFGCWDVWPRRRSTWSFEMQRLRNDLESIFFSSFGSFNCRFIISSNFPSRPPQKSEKKDFWPTSKTAIWARESSIRIWPQFAIHNSPKKTNFDEAEAGHKTSH